MTTTSTALDQIGQRAAARAPQQIGQVTAVEQSRAIAEVHAAVTVAQQIPRDQDRAIQEMRDTCGRLSMASRAFYTVPNRGTGPSVHLARELARIWGNIQSGVHELRRDDTAGESEVQAFAWDLQTNSRTVRTFINPHARMKGRQRQQLDDIDDIYRSNQNTGAKAVRECILNVLPRWFTEEAQDICRATIEKGEGVPLPERIKQAVDAFSRLGIAVPQMEAKVGRAKGAWTAADVADLSIAYTSITRDGIAREELFPPVTVTAEDVVSAPVTKSKGKAEPSAPAQAEPGVEKPSESMMKALHAALAQIGLGGDGERREARLEYLTETLGREVTTSKSLTRAETIKVLSRVQEFLDPAADPTQEPSA